MSKSKTNVHRLIGRPALLTSLLLLGAGSALGAEHGVDPQIQARELLAKTASPAAVRSTVLSNAASRPSVDPQELARRLILGPPAAVQTRTISPAGQERIRSVYPDAQKLAARMISGGAG